MILLLCSSFSSKAATFTTVQDGDWSDPATWGGVYVSSFFPTPVGGPNWFTSSAGDIIIINHDVNMDYQIFIRQPDVLIINSGGSLTTSTGQFYNLSSGDPGTTYSGIQVGVFVFGTLSVLYHRNSADVAVLGGVLATVSGGNLDNFGDIDILSLLSVDGDLNHNSGTITVSGSGSVNIVNGGFQNRAILSMASAMNCIQTVTGSFNHHLGGVVFGSGFVQANGNIDNSSNSPVSWAGVNWCASWSGLNLPAALEDCGIICGSVLPIELLEFSARQDGEAVRLDWITASEVNNDHFDLQVSQDGISYQTIGRVDGSGNSSRVMAYSFVDHSPLPGMSYYRLTQTDYDGAKEFFDWVPVEFQSLNNGTRIYPNPTSDFIYVQGVTGSIQIFDHLGRQLKSYQANESSESQIRIDLRSLGIGPYVLRHDSGSFMLFKE